MDSKNATHEFSSEKNEEPSKKAVPASRLWIGNLDSKLREFNLLKMAEKFGPLTEFDFLYHRSGPQNGQPKGYAFITYANIDHAVKAQRTMDGLEVLGRTLAVKWAHARDEVQYVGKTKPAPPILSISSKDPLPTDKVKKMSKEGKIAALEAQLKTLEENSGEMSFTPDIGGPSKPTSVTYKYIEQKPKIGPGANKVNLSQRRHTYAANPYHKRHHRK